MVFSIWSRLSIKVLDLALVIFFNFGLKFGENAWLLPISSQGVSLCSSTHYFWPSVIKDVGMNAEITEWLSSCLICWHIILIHIYTLETSYTIAIITLYTQKIRVAFWSHLHERIIHKLEAKNLQSQEVLSRLSAIMLGTCTYVTFLINTVINSTQC